MGNGTECYVGGNRECWVCQFFGYLEWAFGLGNARQKRLSLSICLQIFSTDSQIRANSFR